MPSLQWLPDWNTGTGMSGVLLSMVSKTALHLYIGLIVLSQGETLAVGPDAAPRRAARRRRRGARCSYHVHAAGREAEASVVSMGARASDYYSQTHDASSSRSIA